MGKAVVTVLGEDKVGIVAGVSKTLAENGVNIEDISQTIMRDLFAMVMLVTLDEGRMSIGDLQERLKEAGKEIGVHITVQHEDLFRFMHRI
ncbi:MAG: ACT domain-containing protein [Candidatus Aquicultorales bacterium]